MRTGSSTMSWKWTLTRAYSRFWWLLLLWMSSDTLLRRSWRGVRGGAAQAGAPTLRLATQRACARDCSPSRTCLARLPNTKSSASMTLLLPLPLGPTTEEKLCARETEQEVSAKHRHLSHRSTNWGSAARAPVASDCASWSLGRMRHAVQCAGAPSCGWPGAAPSPWHAPCGRARCAARPRRT